MSNAVLGGIGLTHLRVYQDRPGPDGVHAGCAHIHALTPEAYFGISGEGAIELHDLQSGYRRLPIVKGTFVQFQPGSLHRSVSTDHLEVLAIMGNGGLAERGDARIYFGEEVDNRPAEYERLRNLVSSGMDGAMQRRDASAVAYGELMDLWRTDKTTYFAELKRFYEVHRTSITVKISLFRNAIEAGPVAAGWKALSNLEALSRATSLIEPGAAWSNINEAPVVLGMCGELRQIEKLDFV
ncbi:MAG: hypothetical protein HQ483_16570 [Rhodospirillales bacterium]|nr:hypothetical protein [Rhodospirillales bacterium]